MRIASVTGSPLWSYGINGVVQGHLERGWTGGKACTVYTPWSDNALNYYKFNAKDREVVWIPSYGWQWGESSPRALIEQRLFWVLDELDVRVLIVGGTSGTNDWRDEDYIDVGDLVFPWSYYNSGGMASTLPQKNIWGFLPQGVVMKVPYCSDLQERAAEIGRQYFENVHMPGDVRVILRSSSVKTFESEFETSFWRWASKAISEQEGQVYVILHGDSVTPILARHLKMHMLYYHVPVNWANGHPREDAVLTSTLDKTTAGVLHANALDFEHDLLTSLPLEPDCDCMRYIIPRPQSYVDSIQKGK